MILAVPMVVITRIVCDHLDHPYAKTLMRLLEGNVFEVRWPRLCMCVCVFSSTPDVFVFAWVDDWLVFFLSPSCRVVSFL